MKRHILMVLGMVSFALLVLAMAAPDFSGSWVLDSAKSDPVPDMLMLSRPPASQDQRGGRGQGNTEAVMTVQQDGNNLLATGIQGKRHKYTLDGKPYTSTTETGLEKAVTKAGWQGDTLVIEITQPYGGMPGNVTLQIKEEWSLSADGDILTVATTRSTPGGDTTFKQVYSRK